MRFMPLGFTSNRPSFSRDFAALTTIAISLLVVITSWTIYETYKDHEETVRSQLATDATRIDRTLVLEFEQAAYLLESISRQILHIGPNKLQNIALLLRSFDKENTVFHLFSWINANQQIVATSEQGILARNIDVSDRDYMKKTIIEPWKVQVGRPIKGRITGRRIIPLAMGVDDYKGNYIGTVLVSVDIARFTKKIKQQLFFTNTNFAIVTDSFMPVLESATTVDFINNYLPIAQILQSNDVNSNRNITPHQQTQQSASITSLWSDDKLVTYYQYSANYPYIILLGLDPKTQLTNFQLLVWKRVLPLFGVGALLWFMLWTIRNRIITPLHKLATYTEQLARGQHNDINLQGPREITYLANQLQKISNYIAERKRIEHEQRNKTALMKRAKEQAELSSKVKLDFMNAMSHELRIPLNNIIGFSEIMKNEVYGAIENEQYKQYIEDIYHSAELLQSLINDVLALGKAEAEMIELQEKPVDVQFIITKCIRVLGDRLKEAGITIENRTKKDLPKLRVDELRLKQIIMNLLTNSISHTPSGGSIVIEAAVTKDKKEQKYFEIIITDFGAKRLPLQKQNTIREQMDESGKPRLRSRAHIGQISNLGIPLTKALVAMHQAVLDIQSPAGKATKVIVRFSAERIIQ